MLKKTITFSIILLFVFLVYQYAVNFLKSNHTINYSIENLKEAGFTMAFIGESNKSDNLVHVGSDKFRLRRFVIVTYTTINDLKNYFDQIK